MSLVEETVFSPLYSSAESSPFVPVDLWHKDHWSTFAYAETVMVEMAGFQVGFDARMRQNRRNHRIMSEHCPRPRRPSPAAVGYAMDEKYSTRLRNGTIARGHDDWNCIQDMAHHGLFVVVDQDGTERPCSAEDVEPGVCLRMSGEGYEVIAKLRAFKSKGGSFGTFSLN